MSSDIFGLAACVGWRFPFRSRRGAKGEEREAKAGHLRGQRGAQDHRHPGQHAQVRAGGPGGNGGAVSLHLVFKIPVIFLCCFWVESLGIFFWRGICSTQDVWEIRNKNRGTEQRWLEKRRLAGSLVPCAVPDLQLNLAGFQ